LGHAYTKATKMVTYVGRSVSPTTLSQMWAPAFPHVWDLYAHTVGPKPTNFLMVTHVEDKCF